MSDQNEQETSTDIKNPDCNESENSKARANNELCSDTADNLQASMESCRMQDKYEAKIRHLNREIARYQKDLDFYSLHYPAAIGGRDEYQQLYTLISNSYYWKMTKPLRLLGTGIKKIMRSVPGLRALFKVFSRIRYTGVSATSSQIKAYLGGGTETNNSRASAVAMISEQALESQRQQLFDRDIRISVLVPLYNTPRVLLEEMIRSVTEQTYACWELCLADGSDEQHEYVGVMCQALAQKDSRIKYKKLESNEGISENTNRCIDLSTGSYLALLDHDDLLHPAALYEVMLAITEKNADFIFSDEAVFTAQPADAHLYHFKPDYSPDTLRSYNYICHFSTFSRALMEKVGTFNSNFDGSQDYDITLRLTEQAQSIVHIPKILYFWRAHAGSVASEISAKPYAIDAAKGALAAHLDRLGLKGHIDDSVIPSIYKISYEINDDPLVSIIIPNIDQVLTLEACIDSILNTSTYSNFEIIIIENNSQKQETFDYYTIIEENPKIRVVYWEDEFNYSAINNFGAKYAKGDYLLLLNNDITVITPDWIQEMLMYAQRPDVGAVGAKLYYPDDTIQHAGTILGLGGFAGHSHVGFPRNHSGDMGRLILAQNLTAVTAACLMLRKDVFDEIGGFDTLFKVALNDVDLCMRIRDRGYLIVFTPFAELYHYESKSRGYEDTPEKIKRFNSEVSRFKSRWHDELQNGDPYYNPNLTLERADFSIK